MAKPVHFTLALLLACTTALHAAPNGQPSTLPAVLVATGTAALPAMPSSDALVQLLRDSGALTDVSLAAPSGQIAQRVRDAASGLVLSAVNFLGVRYRRGGSSVEQGFDCSGFTRYVFEHSIGLVLPHRAEQQAHDAGLLKIGREELRPGDLVFFNTMRRAFSHVGIYIGEGRFIHAPRPGGEVRIEDIHQAYWAHRFNGARRAEPLLQATAANTANTAEAAPAPPAEAVAKDEPVAPTPALTSTPSPVPANP